MLNGLVGLAGKSEEVVRTMLTHVMTHRELEVCEAVKKSLVDDHDAAAKVLDELKSAPADLERAKLARAVYQDMTGRSSDGEPKSDPATQAGYTKALHDLHEHLRRVYPNFQSKGIDWDKVGQEPPLLA